MIPRDKLGPNSPLLTKSGRARSLRLTEFPVQAGIVEAIVGKIGPGGRTPGAGITGRYPEAGLLHAVPNGASASSKAAAAKRKVEGQLKDMPDLCLPVARGPYIGLYIEVKRPGIKSARPGQRQMAVALRSEGHAVATVNEVQGGVDLILTYLAMPKLREALAALDRCDDPSCPDCGSPEWRKFERLYAQFYTVGAKRTDL